MALISTQINMLLYENLPRTKEGVIKEIMIIKLYTTIIVRNRNYCTQLYSINLIIIQIFTPNIVHRFA